MLIWGGYFDGSSLDTGERYDPATDTWTPIATLDAPIARYLHVAVWTGAEMVVWGGWGGAYLSDGGRYDPIADRWRPTSIIGAPPGRLDFTAVWTGTRMLIWGGWTSAGSIAYLN